MGGDQALRTHPQRHLVLVHPQVHWNTGNIGRTCLGVGAHLHLIRPLGFSLDSRHLRRAGLDYWSKVKLSVWDDFVSWQQTLQPGNGEMVVLSAHAVRPYWQMPKPKRLFLVLGSETDGLPTDIMARYPDSMYTIPINDDIRCLNLSTAAAVALFESLRPTHPA